MYNNHYNHIHGEVSFIRLNHKVLDINMLVYLFTRSIQIVYKYSLFLSLQFLTIFCIKTHTKKYLQDLRNIFLCYCFLTSCFGILIFFQNTAFQVQNFLQFGQLASPIFKVFMNFLKGQTHYINTVLCLIKVNNNTIELMARILLATCDKTALRVKLKVPIQMNKLRPRKID